MSYQYGSLFSVTFGSLIADLLLREGNCYRYAIFYRLRVLNLIGNLRYQGRTSQSGGRGLKSGSHKAVGDYYKPVSGVREVRRLLTEAVKVLLS